MARRPVFMPGEPSSLGLVTEQEIEFEWSPGFALTQKQKNIRALHEAASEVGLAPLLEVSTKSLLPLGRELSAFNLTVRLNDLPIRLEAAFQGSKVFTGGGPFTDLYEMEGSSIKRDARITNSGPLVAFEWDGVRWPLEPKTAFYDWLYVRAVDVIEVGDELDQYAGFTDIEFNPKKSINCQARSCALYISLKRRGLLRRALSGKPEDFRSLLEARSGDGGNQASLF